MAKKATMVMTGLQNTRKNKSSIVSLFKCTNGGIINPQYFGDPAFLLIFATAFYVPSRQTINLLRQQVI